MAPAAIWDAVCDEMRQRVQAHVVDLWLAPLQAVGEEDGRLLVVGDAWLVTWVMTRYGRVLGELVREVSTLEGVRIREREPLAVVR